MHGIFCERVNPKSKLNLLLEVRVDLDSTSYETTDYAPVTALRSTEEPRPTAPESQELSEEKQPFQTGASQPSYGDDPQKRGLSYERSKVDAVGGWTLHAGLNITFNS